MDPQPVYYDSGMFLATNKGNKISKQSLVRGSEHIHLNGKTIIHAGAIVRGDLAIVKMGTYGVVKEDVVLRPTYKRSKGKLKYVPLSIGENVYIDKGSIVCASKIGSCVYIGKNCIIGHRTVIKDNSKILDDSILAPDTVVPPFAVFGG